jgi:small-conductance mechanosensitive channel
VFAGRRAGDQTSMELVIESLRADWESFLRFAPRLLYGLFLLLIFLIVAKTGGRLAARILERSDRFRSNKRFFRYIVTGTIASIGFLLTLGIMGFHGIVASLLATGGIAAIVIGFAFREVGENFLAGFFLTISRPFKVGDLIKTGDLLGVVRSIELRHVHVRTFDACDVFVPSAQMFREPLFNYTQDGLRRPSFVVGVAYHHEPDVVIDLLERAAANVADVLEDPMPFVTVKDFGALYVEYEIFFWIDVEKSERGYIATKNAVKISCWYALRDANLTFSTDVISGFEIKKIPAISVSLANKEHA